MGGGAGRSVSVEAAAPVRVVLYHHTHWDREWWATFQAFRFRLVQTLDRLLDTLEADPGFTCFVLDGQTIVLEDYLEVRPEQRERLVGLVRAGRIHVGPWYVLADQFLTSGEAVIRNLWLGERLARRLGVENRRVGYLPDQFGHIAQMPQLLRGFGIESAVVWRGFGAPPPADRLPAAPPLEYPRRFHADGSYPDAMRSEFWWEAPDGTRVLGVYLALEYYRGHFKPSVPADERSRQFVEYMRPYSTTDAILEPYGGDHLPVDPRLPAIVAELAEQLAPEGIEYSIGSLEEYVEHVRRSAPELDVVWRGEGRAYGRRAHLLPGVLSTRLHLKRANRDAQVQLERYAEPFQAFEWQQGGRYEQEYLWTAWRHLVQNHPHDSICGCSIDQVHREMLWRFAQAQQAGELLALDAQERLAARMAPAPGEPEGAQAVVVFNPLNWTRTEAVSVLVDPRLGVEPAHWRLLDAAGKEVPFQARPLPGGRLLRTDSADWTEVTFAVRDLPGFGYRRFRFEARERALELGRVRPYTVLGDVARDKGAAATTGLAIGPGRLENEHLVVTVDEGDGTLAVVDRASGLEWRGLNALLDGGDAGDTYNHSAPLGDQLLRWRGRARLTWIEKGPARATLRVTRAWSLPAGLSEDRDSRASDEVPAVIHCDVTLAAGARRVDIRTHFVNGARDHRLQACFPLGAPVATSAAESAFTVVERPTRLPAGERGSAEPAVPEHPQQAFASVSDGARGLTIANRGLPEFSATEDGELRLTLVRSVGWLSRDDLLSRVGGAGPAIATPEAQCLGEVEARYSIIPHAGGWEVAGAAREAHAFNAEPAAVAVVPQGLPLPHPRPAVERTLPPEGHLLEVEGDVMVTAVKRAEDNPWLVVRLVNLGSAPATARVRPAGGARRAFLLDLREQPQAEFDLAGGGVELPVRPWQLATVGFEL